MVVLSGEVEFVEGEEDEGILFDKSTRVVFR
jgi:hypothetical protein